MKKVMILVVDGCAPGYITEEKAPALHRMAAEGGFSKTVLGAMPSVTNVNHACILSGRWPEDTKVTGNYYYRPDTGEEGFIEERGYMKAETLLQNYRRRGGTTALMTVKGKVLGVYGDGADIGLSVQTPDSAVLERYGLEEPPGISAAEATGWIVKAALECIRKDSPDLMYCTTNDYIFHHFAPGEPPADAQIRDIDRLLEEIHELEPERQIYVTADHGMNRKTTIVNFSIIAENAGFDVFCLPPLKDRYVENHIYQEGGMIYVFMKDGRCDEFRRFAGEHPLVERVLTADEAAREFHLPEGETGDFVLLSGRDTAFGEAEDEWIETDISRTHGSVYEREVPLIAVNPERGEEEYSFHKDVASYLMK